MIELPAIIPNRCEQAQMTHLIVCDEISTYNNNVVDEVEPETVPGDIYKTLQNLGKNKKYTLIMASKMVSTATQECQDCTTVDDMGFVCPLAGTFDFIINTMLKK